MSKLEIVTQVASYSDPSRSILYHEKEGIICNFYDTAAMELGIKRLLQEDDLRMKLAQQKVRSLTWEASIKKLSEIYEEWVKEHQKLYH